MEADSGCGWRLAVGADAGHAELLPLTANRQPPSASLQRLARMRPRAPSSLQRGVPTQTTSPPASPPSGPRSISQSAARDHVEIVLDDEQRMAGVDQPAERAQQLGDVVEVQAGRRLVEQKQRAARAAVGTLRSLVCRARWPASFSRCASPPDSVGTGWPELQIVEADLDQRLQVCRAPRARRRRTRRLARPSCRARRRCCARASRPRFSVTSRISAR